MPIDAISRDQPSRIDYDIWQTIEPLIKKPKDSGIAAAHAKDTIAEAASTWGHLYPEAVAAWRASLDTGTARPKLEYPQIDPKSLSRATEEIGALIVKVASGDTADEEKQEDSLDRSLAEISLLQAFIQCMKIQQEHQLTNAELLDKIISRRRDENAALKQDYFNKVDEQIARNKKSNILSWISGILWGALAVVGIASLALSIATAGITAPIVITMILSLAGATLAIGSGSLTIAKGVMNYINNKLTGLIKEIEFDRKMNHDRIKTAMEEMQQSMQVIADCWKEMAKVANEWRNAAIAASS